jgi:predicted MFS family arabinose efflux permease
MTFLPSGRRRRPDDLPDSDERTFAFEVRVALGLAGGAMVALGFTRFAYALLVPPMRADLDWSFTAAGGMNTANAAGYVLGAASATWWGRRFGAGRAFTTSMAASAVVLVLSGLSSNYGVLAALRFVGGLGTAVTFVLGSALAARAHRAGSHKHSATLVAVYMAGVGLGIIVSGAIVPSILAKWGTDAWPWGWIAMGVLAALLLPSAAWAVRQVPAQAAPSTDSEPSRLRPLAPLFGWYVLFGAGYVSYMTFVIALLHDQEVGLGGIAAFFIVLGAASVTATLLVWGRVIVRLSRGFAPALISVVAAVGVLPVLLGSSLVWAITSAVIFGSTFMAGPTSATVLARRMLPPHGWTRGIALLTVAFSVGQALGPLFSGLLSDTDGGIALGLWLSVALLIVAGGVALTQRNVSAPVALVPARLDDSSPTTSGTGATR